MYRFPENLYADVRIEEVFYLKVYVGTETGWENPKMEQDVSRSVGVMVRVFDGMWYTSSFEEPERIQEELDRLAALAVPNPAIWEHPEVKLLEANRDTVLRFGGEAYLREEKDRLETLLSDYYDRTWTEAEHPLIGYWEAELEFTYKKKRFYSSKGAELVHDMQDVNIWFGWWISLDGTETAAGKRITASTIEGLCGHEQELLEEMERTVEYAQRAADVEPGEYCCVLAPQATAIFTHEAFGHSCEADDVLLCGRRQEGLARGVRIADERVSICDNGALFHRGYVPYDDEGTRAKETWLVRNGILSGWLHDAKSAADCGEALTGNARAQDAASLPIVRMTNIFFAAGPDDPQRMVGEIANGLYIAGVDTGELREDRFILKPSRCYRIRDGRLCEPVRVHELSGDIYQTLREIDAVGNDFEVHGESRCGKMGQLLWVTDGGPSIRVRRLNVR